MTRGAKGCLIVAAGMLAVLVVMALFVLMAGGVSSDTILKVTIAGEIVEDHQDTLESRFFRGKVTVLRDITTAIDRARIDEDVNGMYAVIKPFSMGMGKIQEIRDAVTRFRESGKWARVHIDSAGEFSSGNGTYYLAAAFDEVWMSPAGNLNLFGLLSVTPFLRGLYEKIGVYPDIDSIGEYKSAKDIYTNKEMTDAHREANMTFMQDWYDQIVDGIATSRGMDTEEVDTLINSGPYTGEEALELGLIDKLAYYDEFITGLEELNEGELPVMTTGDYLENSTEPSGDRIAVITGHGVIYMGKSSVDPWGGAAMGAETISETFKQAREDGSIRAVVFRVNSPGGSPLASDLIWREVSLTAEVKPVIISMSDYAASGGYYVAMGGTKVVTQPGTLTGSIGVVAGKMVTDGLYDMIGINREVLKIGDNATYYYSGQKFSDAEREIYYKHLNKVYEQFTTKVADGRDMTFEEVDAVGRGHVWTGERALELGLVDELGGMYKSIEVAKAEAGIDEDRDVRLVYLPPKKSFWEDFFWSENGSLFRSGVPVELIAGLREVSKVMLLGRESVWMIAETPGLDP